MYCKKCGTEQKEGQRFCPKCGAPFVEEEISVNNNKEKVNVVEAEDDIDGVRKNANQLESSFMKNWKIWALLLGLYLLFKMCGGCNGCGDGSNDSSYDDSVEQSSSSDNSNRAPSWIQGTWYCVTPYGNMQVEIVGDHIREIPGDGSSYYGTYHIQGDAIMPETGSQMYYQMDFDNKRLSAGQGYYFRKQ